MIVFRVYIQVNDQDLLIKVMKKELGVLVYIRESKGSWRILVFIDLESIFLVILVIISMLLVIVYSVQDQVFKRERV